MDEQYTTIQNTAAPFHIGKYLSHPHKIRRWDRAEYIVNSENSDHSADSGTHTHTRHQSEG